MNDLKMIGKLIPISRIYDTLKISRFYTWYNLTEVGLQGGILVK